MRSHDKLNIYIQFRKTREHQDKQCGALPWEIPSLKVIRLFDHMTWLFDHIASVWWRDKLKEIISPFSEGWWHQGGGSEHKNLNRINAWSTLRIILVLTCMFVVNFILFFFGQNHRWPLSKSLRSCIVCRFAFIVFPYEHIFGGALIFWWYFISKLY